MGKISGKRKIICLVVLFLSVFVNLASAVDLPSIDKSKIRLLIAPQKTEFGQIIVENQSPESRRMRVYLSDWDYLPASDGTKEFFPANSTPLSCASWISFSPSEFTLQPFSRQKIEYSVKVPQNASGGYYAALFFESVFEKAVSQGQGMQAGMNLVVRVATLFYVDVDGTVKRNAQIDNFSFKKDPSANLYSIESDFRNTGNVDITAGGSFHLMNQEGIVLYRGLFNDIYTFPNASAKLSSSLKQALPQGEYDLILSINLGKALEEANIGRGPVITKESRISIGKDGKVLNAGPLK